VEINSNSINSYLCAGVKVKTVHCSIADGKNEFVQAQMTVTGQC